MTNPGPLTQTQYAPVAAAALTSAVATPWLDIGGYDLIALQLALVDADSSVSRLDINVELSQSATAPTATGPTMMTAAEPTGGVVTYDSYDGQIAVAGSKSYYLHYRVNAQWIRFTVSAGAGTAAAADTVAISVRAGVGGE